MNGNSIFISHSSMDARFVTLLDKLLQHHGLAPWHAERDLPPAKPFNEAIIKAIYRSYAMIVLVSREAARSRWVGLEVDRFHTGNRGARIISLRLDDTTPMDIHPVLAEYPDLEFSDEGFERLFRAFDRTFLKNRRSHVERRRSSVAERMAAGFVINLTRGIPAPNCDPDGPFSPDIPSLRMNLLAEAQRYKFRDSVTRESLDPEDVIDQALLRVDGELLRGGLQAMRELATSICDAYFVEMKDRRATPQQGRPEASH